MQIGNHTVIPYYEGPIPHTAFFKSRLSNPRALGILADEMERLHQEFQDTNHSRGKKVPVTTALIRKVGSTCWPVVRSITAQSLCAPLPRSVALSDARSVLPHEIRNALFPDISDDGLATTLQKAKRNEDSAKRLLGPELGIMFYDMFNRNSCVYVDSPERVLTAVTVDIPRTNESVIYYYAQRDRVAQVATTMAHELAHVIQHEVGYVYGETSVETTIDESESIEALLEGSAVGVEGVATLQLQNYFLGIRNEYLRYKLKLLATSFLYFSQYASTQSKQNFKKTLAKIPFLHEGVIKDKGKVIIDNTDIGAALFAIAENIHGPEIYRRMLLGDLAFLDL